MEKQFYILSAISPLDGRYHSKTEDLRGIFSEFSLIKLRLKVEVLWLVGLAQSPDFEPLPPLDKESLAILDGIVDKFSMKDAQRVKELEAKVAHDVKAVEYFLRERLGEIDSFKPFLSFVHFGCTSEDINSLAYAKMLEEGRLVLCERINKVIDALTEGALGYASVPMIARTHGQAASPTTLGKEFANIAYRLSSQLARFEGVKISGKFGGAVGHYNAHIIAFPEVDWALFCRRFVEGMNLTYTPYTTQIEPFDSGAELLHCIARVNSILMDAAKDFWAYISIGYFKQRRVKGEVGSSAMPHKVNPIDFENAEGNLGIANALGTYLANSLTQSRWQRDLTGSTQLRNLGVVFAHSFLAYNAFCKGFGRLDVDRARLDEDLNSHWEVLAEAVQSVLRRYGVEDAYERLQALTQGRQLDNKSIRVFVSQCDIPKEARERLLNLTPHQYIGLSERLALMIEEELSKHRGG